ncbi:MAG: ATP-binding protein [Desulfobacterales bacterium]|nr:ATP-binding protein [Desulfobacterales bacterium]
MASKIMWRKIQLKTRLFAILTGLVLISFIGGTVMVWYTYRIERLLSNVIDKHLAAFESAEALETALVNQKGFVSYYLMDHNPDWLRQLGEYRQIFKERLLEAKQNSDESSQNEILARIEHEYNQYIASKDRVIDFYKASRTAEGATLHVKVRSSFFTILDLCNKYKSLHKQQILKTREVSHTHALQLRIIAALAAGASALLALGLAIFLFNQILDPVHRLAMEAERHPGKKRTENDISALHRSVRGLLEDVDTTRHELEKSREHLLQSEKLALVGKLAAGMAHSIRNPFTSVKMRLFSLSRAMELTETQREDLSVISEEIRHIDTIVQNFLEFSRPPRLQIQRISPSIVVNQALQLLVHRLKSYAVEVTVKRQELLPEILIDPEQLKEVFVNLIVNACEAMEHGGEIVITENVTTVSGLGKSAIIEVIDNGPGIPETLRDKVFQPFFTTKDEGTGLGLAIAARIIEEHQGRIEVVSPKDRGTTFSMVLPLEDRVS